MKYINIVFILILLVLTTACKVTINPIGVLVLDEENIDFDYVEVDFSDEITLNLTNIGKSSAQIVSFRINSSDSNTSVDEFTIEPSVMPTKFLLGKKETQPFKIKFTPTSVGDKSANLVIQVIMYDDSRIYEFPVTGKGYSGQMSIYPPLVGYPHLYVGEKEVEEFTVANIDIRPLTITSIYFTDFSEHYLPDEFKIVSGWSGDPIVLDSYKAIKVVVQFSPKSIEFKSAYIVVQVAESEDTDSSMLAGRGCEHVEILTTTLPDGIHGYAYNHKLLSQGGDLRFNYGIQDGQLPAGLWIDNITRHLTGTPEEHGDFHFTLFVQDNYGHKATQEIDLHINYAMLYRDPTDIDPVYVFDRENFTGLFTVNLICEGDIPLKLKDVRLVGIGANSNEAQILTHNIPDEMQPGNKLTLEIGVESRLDDARYVVLIIEHSGYNTDFEQILEWDIVHDTRAIFIVERSDDMSDAYSGVPVYDLNGNIITNPTKMQYAQYNTYIGISKLHPGDMFDVIVFGDNVYTCFGNLRDANPGNRKLAIDWLFGITPWSHSNAYDALDAAYNNYGELDLVEFYTVGTPDTAISLGCNPGDCDQDWLNQKTFDDLRVWIQPSVDWYDNFRFYVNQIGGSQTSFVRMLRNLPKTVCTVR